MVSDVSKDGFTITVKIPVPTFPSSSVAVQVTVVVPMGNVAPYFHQLLGPSVSPPSWANSLYVGTGDAEQVVVTTFNDEAHTPK